MTDFESKQHLLGEIAVELGLLTRDQVKTCIKIQQTSVIPVHLGQICIEEGFLETKQVRELLKEQNKRIFVAIPNPDPNQASPMPKTDKDAMKLTTVRSTVSQVLCVDDSAIARQFVKVALSEDFDVTLATNGTEALDVLRRKNGSQPFDLIILDIVMPVMDGFKVAEAIRKEPSGKSVPIMFMTQKTSPEIKDRVKEVGGVGFIEKRSNDDPVKFLSKVREIVLKKMISKPGAFDLSEATGIPTVLLVDDCRATRTCVQVLLRRKWNVLMASDGYEALESFKKNKQIKVVITDVKMPGMDGFELIREIQKLPGGANAQVIVLSSIGEVEKKKLSKGAKVFAHIKKRDLREPKKFLSVLQEAITI